jgi:hypothetical protein
MKIYSKKIAEELAKIKLAPASEEDTGTFEVIATTEDTDRHGEVIKIDGWMLDNYMKNPIILFGHNYSDQEAVVGKATDIRIE